MLRGVGTFFLFLLLCAFLNSCCLIRLCNINWFPTLLAISNYTSVNDCMFLLVNMSTCTCLRGEWMEYGVWICTAKVALLFNQSVCVLPSSRSAVCVWLLVSPTIIWSTLCGSSLHFSRDYKIEKLIRKFAIQLVKCWYKTFVLFVYFFGHCYCCLYIEIGSHYVVQAGLLLKIILPHPPGAGITEKNNMAG
jgi:hypothetical protein